MSISCEIEDGLGGTKYKAKVTQRGQLVTSPIDFSVAVFREMSVINTAFNFFEPKAGLQQVITDIIIETDKNVSTTNGSLVEIFSADSATSTVAVSEILTSQPGKLDSRVLTGLNFVILPGFWINAVCDDATVFLTLAGYTVSVEET